MNSSRIPMRLHMKCLALLFAPCMVLMNAGCATQAVLQMSRPREMTRIRNISRAFIRPNGELVLNVRELHYRARSKYRASLVIPIDDVRSDHVTYSRKDCSLHTDIMLPKHVINKGWIDLSPSDHKIPVTIVQQTQNQSMHNDIMGHLSQDDIPNSSVFKWNGVLSYHFAYHDTTDPLSQRPYVRFVLPETKLYYRRVLLVLIPFTVVADVVALPFQLWYASALDGMF